MGDASVTVLALAALLLFLLSSTQVAHRIRPLRGTASRLVIRELDGVGPRAVGAMAPLIAAASQLPVAYVLLLREHELSLLASVVLLSELYVAAGWMAHLTEARRHLREALRTYEERRRLQRAFGVYRR